MSTRPLRLLAGLLAAAALVCAAPFAIAVRAQDPNDLDAFMARVLERRSENWKALKDYVLNEQERFEILGPGRERLFGTNREFTWYLRDGMLVRSPVRFDGVAISAEERKKYEDNWTREERQRDERRARRTARAEADGKNPKGDDAADVIAMARDASEPRIISQAYFMDFHFEPGNYYLAGRETLEGRQVLRIEYYPTHLFKEDGDERRQRRAREKDKDKNANNGDKDSSNDGANHGTKEKDSRQEKDSDRQREIEFERQFNKVAMVTLWVDPQEHQIVKFTFSNVDFGFLPGRWLVRADDMTASMVMSQPIQGIWLPREISGSGRITLANGSYEIRYGREFSDYQQGEVKTRIRGYTPKDQ